MSNLSFTFESFLTEDYRHWCVENKETLIPITIMTEKGHPEEISLPAKELIFNIFLWKPLIRRNLPIVKERHLFHDEDFTSEMICRINTEIFMDVIKERPETVKELKIEFIRGIEEMNNFINSSLNRFVYMVDVFSIAETLTTPEAKQITHAALDDVMNHNVKVVEKMCKDIQGRTTKYFADKNTHPNIFYPAVHLGTLNPIQFAQMVACVGTRTDTDESMIRWPVTHNFMEGLNNIGEYCLESLAAKKSEMYNAVEMAPAQYTNRKFQLNASVIKRIYPGDCGSEVTVPFSINEENYKHVFGKYFKENNQVVLFNKENAKKYIGQSIHLYSPLTCRHTDGYCFKCGGLLAQYFLPSTAVPGIIAGSEVMSPLVQQILSNKHMATTFATLYTIPDEFKSFFVNRGNSIYFDKEFSMEGVHVGIPYAFGCKLSDLKDVKGPIKDAEYFTKIPELALGDSQCQVRVSANMTDGNRTIPYFSREFLEYIKKNPECMKVIDPVIWIDISKFPKSQPFMIARIFNYSTKLFVDKIQHVFKSEILHMTSCTEFLEKISSLIWMRSSPNLLHIETICKSFMRGETSPDVPIVTDPDNVRFSNLDTLIPARSLGTQVGFQKMADFLANPYTFLHPRSVGPFDNLIGFVDEPVP